MSGIVPVLLIVAIIVYVIGRQVVGEPLRGKRVVLLPVVLTVIGVVDLAQRGHGLSAGDVVLLALEALIAVAAGVGLGRSTRLQSRDGYLLARLPVHALWWWAALIAGRLVLTGVAHVASAQLAASGSSIILTLGINRLAQAAVALPRAITAGVPFAPEKDGSSFLGALTGAPAGPQQAGTAWGPAGRVDEPSGRVRQRP